MTIRAASGGVRDQLRSATQDLHQATDEILQSRAAVGSSTGYPTFLAVMSDVFRHFGADCDRASRAMGLSPRAHRLQVCLRRDLDALGHLEPAERTSPLAESQVASLYCAYGYAYALEGSALGAAVLRRAVRDDQQHATNYFDALCGERRSRWPTFTTRLDAMVITTEEFDAMAGGASAVFERVQSVIGQYEGV